MKKMAVLAVLLMVFACGSAQAVSIGLNWQGTWQGSLWPIASGDYAGVVSQQYWNNTGVVTDPPANEPTQTRTNLLDSAGSTNTLVTITYGNSVGNSTGQGNGPNSLGGQTGPIATMYAGGYRSNTDGGSTRVVISGMPGLYDVYVYDGPAGTIAYVSGTNYTKYALQSGTFTWDGNNIAAIQAVQVIPEPAGLGLIGLALLAVRKRRS